MLSYSHAMTIIAVYHDQSLAGRCVIRIMRMPCPIPALGGFHKQEEDMTYMRYYVTQVSC